MPDGGQSCAPFNACVPQWQVPCTANSDCGPGFTCGASGDGGTGVGGFGEGICGPGQYDASIPPYATAMVIPCAEVPMPPAHPGSLQICEAGSTCLALSFQLCVAPPPAPCSVDSDCPSTWTCACPDFGMFLPPVSSPAIFPDASLSVSDAACAKQCLAPNSDLSSGAINGGTEFGVGPGGASGSGAPSPAPPATSGANPDASASPGIVGPDGGGLALTAPADGGVAGSGRGPSSGASSPGESLASGSARGGCEVGFAGSTGEGAPWAALTAFAALIALGVRSGRRSIRRTVRTEREPSGLGPSLSKT